MYFTPSRHLFRRAPYAARLNQLDRSSNYGLLARRAVLAWLPANHTPSPLTDKP